MGNALISANIPFQKLNNFELKNFLEKYTQHNIPDESTIRKKIIYQNISKRFNLINYIPFYKYASLTSCDVERSFSIYKNILTDRRTSLTPEHLEMLLICNYAHRN